MDLSNWLVVVPARLAATRLAHKPLVDLAGLPLVVRVAHNLEPLAAQGARILVATDAAEVQAAAKAHGLDVAMTRADHESGTDRCAEAAAAHPHAFVLNVQGDEPFVDTDDLMALCHAMTERADADMGTLVYETEDQAIAGDPNAVKAVRRLDGYALYFSRAPLPYGRETPQHLPPRFWHHMGVYAFRRERLDAFVKLPPSALERTERLEQLRALENGWRIYLHPARTFARGIDTPDDLEAARARF